MSRQDKATTERHTRILRELVKRPENKVCADCKRNDARWASWNIGAFICIRCSGIHRSMGTHISKVKSVDLDTWTPEQMDSIQRWGNHRANLYWEAHLRPGHIPPEHKMESFIRSKYESKRWAREGPPPMDPSILESRDNIPQESIHENTSPQARPIAVAPTVAANEPPSGLSPTTRQPRPHQLLSAATVGRSSVAQPVQAATPAPAPETRPPPQPVNDLFTLDFHAPSPSLNTPQSDTIPKKDVKSDILSLFSNSSTTTMNGSAQAAIQNSTDSFAAWGQPTQTQAPPFTSMVGQTGIGMWGVQSGWTSQPVPQAQSSQVDIWGSFASSPALNNSSVPQKIGNTNALFETSNVWGGNVANTNGSGVGTNDLFNAPPSSAPTQKKEDVFGDLWGDFK